MNKKSKSVFKRKGFWIALVLVLLAAAGIFFLNKARDAALKAQADLTRSITEAQVSKGELVTTVDGSGNVSVAEVVEITAPTGVKVDKIYVEAGDLVKKGQVLADINKKSVTKAMVTIESDIKSIDKQLEDDKTAEEEDKLTDLEIEMLNEEKEELLIKEDEMKLLHENPVIIAAADGMIGDINISEDADITKTGSMTSSASSSSSDALNAISSLAGLMSYENDQGADTATAALLKNEDTSIKAVRLSEEITIPEEIPMEEEETGDEDIQSEIMIDDGGVVVHSDLSEDAYLPEEGLYSGYQAPAETEDAIPAAFEETGTLPEATPTPALIPVTDYSGIMITRPVAGAQPQSEVAGSGEYTGTIVWSPADATFQNSYVYVASVLLTAADGYCFDGFSSEFLESLNIDGMQNYIWNMSSDRKSLLIMEQFNATDPLPTSTPAPSPAPSVTPTPPGINTYTREQLQAIMEQAASALNEALSSDAGGLSEALNGLTSGLAFDISGLTNSLTSGLNSGLSGLSSGLSGLSGLGSDLSGLTSGLSGLDYSLASGISGSSLGSTFYSNSQAVVFTINKQDMVKIIISVDELDILSINEGQTATVALDALEGETFTGTIYKVSTTGNTGSGNTKYDVEIRIPKADQMFIGMSASATIETGKVDDALLIPMKALQQSGDRIFVYTEKSEDGSLSGEKYIKTGLSDGNNVEVVSGLSLGDRVYYTRSDNNMMSMMQSYYGTDSGEGDSGQ